MRGVRELELADGLSTDGETDEARAHPLFRFATQGHPLEDDVYVALGQTFGGRYLSVFFIYKPVEKAAIIISARDMSDKERKAYGRK